MTKIKFFRTIFFFAILFFLLILSAAYLLSRLYEPEIKKYFIANLNRELTAPIKVKDIRFSLIRNFPYASLEFLDIFIPAASSQKDTLLYAEKLFLQFHLPDVFRKRFLIRKISVEEG